MRKLISKALAGDITCVTVLMCTLALLLCAGCGPDHPGLTPGDVRAFNVPVEGSGPASDSTLCLFSVPEGYTPDKSFPLVVALHGGGSNAARFHAIWQPAAHARGFVLATPQGEQIGPEGIGFRWGPNAEETVRRSIDAMLWRASIARAELYLVGFSQGGHIAYDLAWSHPRAFAGIAALGVGYDLPDPGRFNAPGSFRVYIGHGELEPGLEDVRRLSASLRTRGLEIEMAVYQGIGHGLPEPVSEEVGRILDFLAAPAR
jgi:phospholipase/carboxylesterase